MFTNWTFALLSIASLLISHSALAATIGTTRSGSNSYMFIENRVDNEYFITPEDLNPRFSGANVWTKYYTKQESLGYMGDGSSRNNRYVDLWISNSPINTPFLGLRCRTEGRNCTSAGYLFADVVDREGVYHVRSGDSISDGNQPYGLFSLAAFEFFRSQSVSSSSDFVINWCATRSSSDNYDFTTGVRCKDLPDSRANWETYTLTTTKIGHLSLESSGAMSEIWVASDGTPSVAGNSSWCHTGIVSNVSGIICKMVSYNLLQTKTISSLRFGMEVDTTALRFTPGSTDIKFSGNAVNWSNWNSTTTRIDDIFSAGGRYVYVFFSQAFFNKVLQYGTDLTMNDALFTFTFRNSNTPQSGFYQFTASNHVNIIPKEYGISIVSTDGSAHPQNLGTIGSDTPIVFEYRVTTSASRQADSITAQVVSDSITISGIPWCLFTSDDGTLSVPIPAYLSYTSKSGTTVTQRNSCAESPIDMTSANWTPIPWNTSVDNSFYFETLLKLTFPMNDSRSQFTVAGNEWMGSVSASGELKVTAAWIGVDH